jgi:6-phosphogluconolactonase
VSDEPRLVVVADPAAVAAEAARHIATALADAVAARGRAHWATSGGSTPIGIYQRLVAPPHRDTVPWQHVHVWWGDDRFVPRDHPLSNVLSFEEIVLDIAGREEGTVGPHGPGVRIPVDQIHPFRTTEAIGAGRDAAFAAAELADELRSAGLDTADGWPVFDLMLVGIGPDGHVLSVFPGSAAFDSTAWALAIPAPTHIEPHVERVTLNPAVLGVARDLLAVATGSDKAPVLGQVFGDERDPRRWPAQLARRAGATWILDEAAAADLRRG